MTKEQRLAQIFILAELEKVYKIMVANKPNDKGAVDRHYAICLTDLSKLIAVFAAEERRLLA